MKVTIIGLGAMGSIYAALFANSGFEVIAYDPWVEHINAICLLYTSPSPRDE